jgi:hypothetical protein
LLAFALKAVASNGVCIWTRSHGSLPAQIFDVDAEVSLDEQLLITVPCVQGLPLKVLKSSLNLILEAGLRTRIQFTLNFSGTFNNTQSFKSLDKLSRAC